MNTEESFFNRKKQQHGVQLNNVQKKAVLHTRGPLLLLASPGSGKTTTTIMRIGYLIEEVGVEPSRIKAVTFSRASAADMKERFARFFPEHTTTSVDFSTIHSLAFQVVRDYFYKQKVSYHLIEGSLDGGPNKKLLLRKIYKAMNDEIITEEQLEELTTYISFIKNKLLPRNEWKNIDCDIPFVEAIFEEYEKIKNTDPSNLLLDYDDMLTIANDAFNKDKLILQKYQKRYDYVLTDESQDTSLVQHEIIEKLAKPHHNLFVVADDDQSIYSWRGAEPTYLLDFKKIYPNAIILKMEQNYRSSKDIVDVANRFIKRNKNRYNKNMFTENQSHRPIEITQFEDYRNQAKYLVQEIHLVENKKDVAVLYRNNSSSIMLINELDRNQIPFYIKDSDNRFFSHWVVKDILNFMRMTFTDKRVDIFQQIYTKCGFYLSREQLFELTKKKPAESIFDRLLQNKGLKDYQVKQIQACQKTLQEMQGAKPLKAIKLIRNQLSYDKTLKDMSKKLGFNTDYIFSVLQTLEEIADSLDTMEQFAERLNHLEDLMKVSKFNKNKDAITLSTFHSSKGLEFKKVYMIDLIEGVIPSHDEINKYKDGERDLMEEAVRLFYVGMTRAEQELELLTYKKQNGKEVAQSRFVANVKNIISPPEKVQPSEPKTKLKAEKAIVPYNPDAIRKTEDIQEGMTIKHRVFGQGTVVSIAGEKIEIQFQKVRKSLLLETCLEMGLLEPANEVSVN
ncbi:ATP-dependent helicase [Fredinandcohnia sp. QZ13]|uniref:ATP-dependent helicase n=1 Tax=Fredinandcohnia sp. QZ13 TaxID=3073144 RepID=UPI002853160D|nr:ATP-dependent helicase [Fredinandcohnia sp. QZ13]MDR4886240.1 ATP-dependent helicase [Fredinandcohnia sp. QZ13]